MSYGTYTLRARQSRAGQPINIVVGQRVLSFDNNYPYFGLGLTTTGTSPATRAALVHTDALTGSSVDAFWDRSTQQLRSFIASGVRTVWSDLIQCYKRKPLDANYVAGRYLWVVAFDADPGTGSDVPAAVAGPYHII